MKGTSDRTSPPRTKSPRQDGASLVSLNDDALRAVLLRTRASDHPKLRLSCKRICSIIDSVEFRKDRSEQGYVEVEVEKLTSFEQYQQRKNAEGGDPASEYDEDFYYHYNDIGYLHAYNDFYFHTESFRVYVDGRLMNKRKQDEMDKFSLHMRLLRREAPFWESCDSHDQALSDLGTTLFTNEGKPRVASLKNALKQSGARGGLLYFDELVLPFEYRSIASTVGPLIIKKILHLFDDDLYTIAMYIPCGNTQYSKEDAKAEKNGDKFVGVGDKSTDEEIKAKEERQARNETLMHADMRQFFRAGFCQVDDPCVLESSSCNYVFTTPRDAEKPILSVEEAMDIPIACKAPIRPEATGYARELRLLIQKATTMMMHFMDLIRMLRGSPLENPALADKFSDLTSRLQDLRGQEIELSRTIEQSAMLNREVADLEENRDKIRTVCTDVERQLNERCSHIQADATELSVKVENELETFKTEVREEIKSILDKSENKENPLQLFMDSGAIHLSAAATNIMLVEALLGFLPDTTSEKSKALNALDRFGRSPLMVVASMSTELGLRECHRTLEALINLGADKNIVDTCTGLSALGHFLNSRKKAEIPFVLLGLQGLSALINENASRTEVLLTPDSGPTLADDCLIKANGESESEDESDF